MEQSDPWLVLGLPAGSSLAEARGARRRLAKQLHPDVHGGQADLSARMTTVNQALAEIEAFWDKRPATAPTSPDPVATVRPPATVPSPATWSPPLRAHANGCSDPDSFSVEYLPVDAFEALFVAAYGLGDILVVDEPYLLELYLTEPSPCFCRLALVPEAGGSLVTVDISPADESLDMPESSAVIEVLVAELNALVAG